MNKICSGALRIAVISVLGWMVNATQAFAYASAEEILCIPLSKSNLIVCDIDGVPIIAIATDVGIFDDEEDPRAIDGDGPIVVRPG